MVGHTKSYVKVLIKRDSELVGKRAIVKIVDVHKWHVYGEIVEKNPKAIHVNFNDHFKGMYNTKKNENKTNEILNEIKKEQEDIHATIKFSVKEEKDYEINEENFKSQDSEEWNFKSFDYSNLLFVMSLIYLFIAIYRNNI